ncbi:hypothetical protein DFH11DRAFT_1691418 [Phellopilus nigrolimitatus]|nr:hypothetical protein DFH11DRAFT_1691418 [Phellopilus nigrolimitatus]
MSGRSFGSKRITLRVNITVDYDGPSLSDTSSLVSLDEYKNRNSSGSSLSLSFGSAAHTEPEDDSVTVSSRDTGLLVQKTKTVMNGGSGSTVQDFHTLYGLDSESDASAFDEKRAVPRGSFCSFRAAEVVESSESIERNMQWLRDQTSHAINGTMTPESVVSDGSSAALSGDDLDARSPFDGDLAVQQHNWRSPPPYALSIDLRTPPAPNRPASAASRVSSARSRACAASSTRRARSARGSRRRSRPRRTWAACRAASTSSSFAWSSRRRPGPGTRTARTPATRRETSRPAARPRFSRRNGPLSTLPYPPSVPPSARTRVSTRSSRSSSSRSASSRRRTPRSPCAACASSSATRSSSRWRSSTAMPTALGAPDEPTSALPEDQRTLSQLRRAAPRQKGHFLHTYLEKLRSASGWIDVEQDNISEYAICNTSLTTQRCKCASCNKFVLCRAYYSQMHEVHPSHAFLDVPDRPHRSRSEPDLELTNNLNDDGLGDESLTHPNVKFVLWTYLMDIVGARSHCAICESVGICSNYEAAGLPGNLDADDGDHNTSHVMIKIPIPLNSSKVRRARQLWTGRDSLYVQYTPSRCVRADSLREADAVTIIGFGSKHARGGRCDRKALDLRIANIGVRFQCATCPATKTQSDCLLHNPMHIFFKLPRPVDRPIESQFAILPILYVSIAFPSHIVYRQPAGPAGRLNSSHPKAKDLFDVCENLNPHAHDRTHFFYVFKAPVNTLIVAELDNLEGSPPVLNYPVYYL